MLTPERHKMIVAFLKEMEVAKVQDLTELTQASESTIRRDLIELENEGRLKRVHGGASLLKGKRMEPTIKEKETRYLSEKKVIAAYAATLISDGDSIFLDAGTTTAQVIPFLTQKDITVVTNGLSLLEPLLEKGITTYVLGGMVKHMTGAIIGRGALMGLSTYQFDKCFIGVNGIHYETGFTTPDPEEAIVKYTAMEHSRDSYILADASKFGEISFSKISEIGNAEIITTGIDPDIVERYENYTALKVVTS